MLAWRTPKTLAAEPTEGYILTLLNTKSVTSTVWEVLCFTVFTSLGFPIFLNVYLPNTGSI